MPGLYRKLITGTKIDDCERVALLKIAILLINSNNEQVRELGYRIIVLYGNLFADYEPLYDISINEGYMPIVKLIENKEDLSHRFEESFINMLLSSFTETYKLRDIYQTSQQVELDYFFKKNIDKNIVIVAPTSYGKSERFVNFCNEHKNSSIAMVVPTKALLAQLRSRVQKDNMHSLSKRKIITHPEMYNLGDINFVAILTQERLLRLLQENHELSFDYVFIDEAHNLLVDDSKNQSRNELLAKVIVILNARCQNASFIYLTPFLVNPENLNIRYTDMNLTYFKVSENIKTERYHVIDFLSNEKPMLEMYDQYIDEFVQIDIEIIGNECDFLKEYSGSKNIVYFNSPPKLERFAVSLAQKLTTTNNEELLKGCEDISEFLHKDYALIDCIKSGVIYHHGSVPDIVKVYIEYLYTKVSEIKYIISTSTLLEGVNIPAEKLFLYQYSKGKGNLSPSQFKNLVGRICRFKEIFHAETGSLKMLEPEVYIIKSQYMSERSNVRNFVRNSVKADKEIRDVVENVLLESTPITEGNKDKIDKANEILENLLPGVTGSTIKYAQTNFGKSCFNNNIFEFDIIENEVAAQNLLLSILRQGEVINDPERLIDIIYSVFVQFITDEKYENLTRLSEEKARIFYKMLLDWRIRNASFAEMVSIFLKYWEKKKIDDPLVYVHKWGDTKHPNSFNYYWVDIRYKTKKELVNLAIVRIKEEQDFLDNQIMKFVEVLNDLELIERDFYTTIKYGTTDTKKIIMIKNGLSSGLAALLVKKYVDYLIINIEANTVSLKKELESAMERNNENGIYIFEASFYTS